MNRSVFQRSQMNRMEEGKVDSSKKLHLEATDQVRVAVMATRER